MAALFLTLAACALHAQPTQPSFEVASIRPTKARGNAPAISPSLARASPAAATTPYSYYRYQFTNCPIDRLANAIQADHPILDKTGLTGLDDIVFFATADAPSTTSPTPVT